MNRNKSPIPRRKAMGFIIATYMLGTGGGIVIHPYLAFPGLVGFAVVGIGLALLLGAAIYPSRRL